MKLTFLAAAIVLNAALIVLGRGSFLHGVLVLAVVVYLGAPAAAIAAVLYFVRRPRFVRAAKIIGGVAALCVSTIASAVIGQMVLRHDIADAQSFCEAAIPQLDRYRKEKGVYPKEIGAVTKSTPPHLLREGGFYHSDGNGFTFFFSNPGGMLDGFEFDSEKRRWNTWD